MQRDIALGRDLSLIVPPRPKVTSSIPAKALDERSRTRGGSTRASPAITHTQHTRGAYFSPVPFPDCSSYREEPVIETGTFALAVAIDIRDS